MNKVGCFTLVILVACAASTGVAQQSTAGADSAVVKKLLDSARTLGLPDRPLQSVIDEGRQRNETQARVVAAVRRYIDVLSRSKQALGPHATNAEIDAGASVLLAGADAGTLSAVRGAREGSDVTVALVVLGDLVDRGVAIPRAEDAVVTLVRVGATDAAFHDFRAGVQQDLASGQSAESSLIKRTRETVSRLQVGGRRGPAFNLDDVTLVGTPGESGAPSTFPTLFTGDVPQSIQRSSWGIQAHGAPVSQLPFLQLRATGGGGFARTSAEGTTGMEALATVGLYRENGGAEAGFGASVARGLGPRVPLYAHAWLDRASTRFAVEARFASMGEGAPSTGALLQEMPFPFVASATADTGGNGGLPPVQIPVDSSPGGSPSSPDSHVPAHVTELRFGISHPIAALMLDLTSGLRLLDQRPFDSWTSLSVTAPVHPQLSFIGGVTARRIFGVESATAGSHVFLGVQLHPSAHSMPVTRHAPAPSTGRPSGALRATPAGIVFEIAADAREVHVCGDFTLWRELPMLRAGGNRWRIVIPPNQTVVRLRVRVDGGEWFVPEGVSRGRSAFGDEVGVLVLDSASR